MGEREFEKAQHIKAEIKSKVEEIQQVSIGCSKHLKKLYAELNVELEELNKLLS